MEPQDYSELHLFQDDKMDFFAAICLHSENHDTAIGGCRFIEYSSKEAAISDAIRLSKAMRNKSKISELALNGGKAVMMLPKKSYDRKAFLKKFAECVDSLRGKYITTIDSGTSQEDMAIIKQYTNYVTGYSLESNPSDSTALGVYLGMLSAVNLKLNKENLQGIKIAIQGTGSVGYRLAKLLHEAGAELILCDKNEAIVKQLAKEISATVVSPHEIYQVECDVFSPCALGRIINAETVPSIKAKIIAGAANDQLSDDKISATLTKKDIFYIPDYLINAGGLIHLALQSEGLNAIEDAVKRIGERVSMYAKKALSAKKSMLEVVGV